MTKKQRIIAEARRILAQYSHKITIRQLYYRLVAENIIPNDKNNYKYYDSVMVYARENGIIPYGAFADYSRENYVPTLTHHPVQFRVEITIESLRNEAKYYTLPVWEYQPFLPVVFLEKQALQSVFKPICRRLEVPLIVGKGFNSLTQVHEALQKLADRPLIILLFGDFDPSGTAIKQNFLEKLRIQGANVIAYKDVALTQQQIKQYQLPHQPVKKSDTRSKNWSENYSVELDALEPNVLEQLIKSSVNQFLDKQIEQKRQQLQAALQYQYKKRLMREIRKL